MDLADSAMSACNHSEGRPGTRLTCAVRKPVSPTRRNYRYPYMMRKGLQQMASSQHNRLLLSHSPSSFGPLLFGLVMSVIIVS